MFAGIKAKTGGNAAANSDPVGESAEEAPKEEAKEGEEKPNL